MAARDPSGAGPGPTQGTKGGSRDKDKTSTGTKGRDPSGAGPGPTQSGSVNDHSVAGGSAKTTARADGGGGTTAQQAYTPGATPVVDDPSAGQVISGLSLGPLGAGGPALTAAGIASADEFGRTWVGRQVDDLTGGTPGPRTAYQPDRYRGQASLNGIGGDGGAVNDGSEREIAGQRFGAGTEALLGDPDEAGPTGNLTDEYSDVALKDRRKPRLGAGTQLLMSA